jgi:hypothetical protein
MPNKETARKHKPSAAAMRAARRWIQPLSGDYIQAETCKELARVIDEEMRHEQEASRRLPCPPDGDHTP